MAEKIYKIYGGKRIELSEDEANAHRAMQEQVAKEQEETRWLRHRLEGKTASHLDKDGKRVIDSYTEGYPPISDQLDQIFHEGIDAWKETIQAVKDAHPKPE